MYCEKESEVLLETNKLPFEKIYIDEDKKSKEFITEQGYKTVPQIWHDDKYVGGYTELVSYM